MASENSERDDVQPPGHPAAATDSVSAGEVLSDHNWASDAAIGAERPRAGADEVTGGSEGSGQPATSPKPNDMADPTDRGSLLDDIAQFVNVDPPESPAVDSDAAAPG